MIFGKTIHHKHTYDNLDKEIIGLLRNDGRASLSDVAKKLNVSRGTVQNRLDKLLESGALLGFTIRIREDYGLDTIRAVMMIKVEGRSTAQIIQKLRGFPELITLHTTNGAWDLIADIQSTSLSDFDRILAEVRVIDGILNSETSILLSSV
ncbi:MAG: DNA-binding Lrp family transcriptional regulator [Saprospiraceae bacterium]|jgi:DNA-binding Lrp family transcriptional regulator